MTCWNHLLTDIFDIIFEYLLEYDNKKTTKDIYYHTTKDIQQCQLTCKSWAGTEQMNLYENLTLYNVQSAELLVHTLSYLCPYLKTLKALPSLYKELWKCIQIERSKGAFSKLQAVTSPILSSVDEVRQYYGAAYSLRETLRELSIYKSVWIENLENFTNIRTLYFKLDSCGDIYRLDQQIKRCSTVEFIGIESMESSRKKADIKYLPMCLTKISPPVDICPQVKQLYVENITFDSRLCCYLMYIFPNLNKLKLDLDFYNNSGSQQPDIISNKTALRILSYIMKMSSASVTYFPVEDIEDLLKNFQDIHGMNRHLNICYKRQSTSSPYLSISTEQNIDILVTCTKYEQINLPLIGIIEKFGRMLQSLTLNMGIKFKLRDPKMDFSYGRADFYHILLYCPNLKYLHILRTLLYCSDIHLQQKQGLLLRNVILEMCSIDDLFFPSLSCHVNYINNLRIRDIVLFIEKNLCTNNKCIDMPETVFSRIEYLYQGYIAFEHRIFLKLKKTEDDIVGWFVSKKNGFERCSEENYEESLLDQHTMSFSICCADICMTEFDCNHFKAIFKTNNY